jgi:hypothetical protein
MRPPKRKSKVTTVFEWTPISSFLNVDLHIRSRDSLEPLLKEWGRLARIPDAKPAHKAHWIFVNLRWQGEYVFGPFPFLSRFRHWRRPPQPSP